MNIFEKHVREIDNEISIKKQDRQVYTKDFDIIRDYLLHIMTKEDEVFNKIYAGPSLFGSHLGNDRLHKPDEFDVHFRLKLPFYEDIKLKRDNARPGFVWIGLSKVLSRMKKDPNWYFVYETFEEFINEWKYLCRNRIQSWLEDIITEALKNYGNRVKNSTGGFYELIYLKRGTAHTIKAIPFGYGDTRKLSIDFVPAFQFNRRSEWLADRPFPENVNEELWFAVPKPTVGPKKFRFLTFSICVPQVENDLLANKYNLKPSMRLFKSLRNKMHAYKLKSYFIKSLYLYENNRQLNEFWKQSAARILMHMIDRLLVYLDRKRLPFYWSPAMNLLGFMDDYEISSLEEQVEDVKSTLDSYFHQPQIKYETVRHLFDCSEKSLKKEYA